MKRHAWLWMGCLFGALPLPAQENVKEEHVETLSADSLITGDARMDSLYRNLPRCWWWVNVLWSRLRQASWNMTCRG